MSYSTSLLAYPDVAEAYERALTAERGIVLEFEDEAQAIRFTGRCNSFRVLHRKENRVVYPDPAHTMHGRSPYDVIFIQRERKKVTMTRVKQQFTITEIE